MTSTGLIRRFLVGNQMKSLLLSPAPPCYFLPSTFPVSARKVARTRLDKNKWKMLHCFFLKTGYCCNEIVSCLGICFPLRAIPVINWPSCALGIVLLECHCVCWRTNCPALCFFFDILNQDKEKLTSCFLKLCLLSCPGISSSTTRWENV